MAKTYFLCCHANYADHLGINPRFDEYMPNDIDIIEKVVKAGQGIKELANELDVEENIAQQILSSYTTAKEIVYAETAESSFRKGVKSSILLSLESGLKSEEDIDNLVNQICYRASDLAYLLDLEDKELSDYSEALRE